MPHAEADPHDITGLLQQVSAGRRSALDELMPLVYRQLSEIAHARLSRETPGHTLETSALVHEAWLRLVHQHSVHWQDRNHFFAVASEVMRRILVDHAKHRCAAKRGSGVAPVALELVEGSLADSPPGGSDELLLALDESLDRLALFNPTGARVVQYRFFAGLTTDEVAELLDTSERTVRRTWTAARAWLRRDLRRAG